MDGVGVGGVEKRSTAERVLHSDWTGDGFFVRDHSSCNLG